MKGRKTGWKRRSATLLVPHFGHLEMGARRPFFVYGTTVHAGTVHGHRTTGEGEGAVSRGFPHGHDGVSGRRGARVRADRASALLRLPPPPPRRRSPALPPHN